jgi:hypothetical protein
VVSDSDERAATELAIELWKLRVQYVFLALAHEFRSKGSAGGITVIAPKQGEIEAIQKALNAARNGGISESLQPVIRLIDAIDNGEKVKPRDVAQQIYDELHTLKAREVQP